MPYAPVQLIPGVNVERTPTLLQAGITSCNLIRFKDGLCQKLGGWDRFYPFALGSTIRALQAWQDLSTIDHLGVGAESSLSVITDGANNDITPRARTTNPSVKLSTTISSTTVTIEDTANGASTYDSVFFATPVAVGGIVLNGLYAIDSVLTANDYTITSEVAATASVTDGGAVPVFATTSGSPIVTVTLVKHGKSVGDTYYFFVSTSVGGVTVFGSYTILTVPTVDAFTISASSSATSIDTESMNGGNARFIYYITVGPAETAVGYSAGGYSDGGYSIGVVPPTSPGSPITATNWTLDNWGEIFVACPQGGAIYQWSPTGGFTTAQIIENAPLANAGIFVSMPQQILVAYGSSIPGIDGAQDPLLVRWTTPGNFTVWEAASTNQAGSFRLSSGSKIVGGIQSPQQACLFTDIDLWLMQYIGYPLVFGFTKVSTGCGLVGPHAVGVLGTTPYWMGLGSFFVLAGNSARALPCPIWDVIFQDLDTANLDKVVCAPNSLFDEVAWYYPSLSGGTGEIDKYVKYNKTENAWDFGDLARTAWIDQSVLGEPIGSDLSNLIMQHEVSNDADGGSMNSFFLTSYFLLNEGQEFPTVDNILPDFKYGLYNQSQGAQVQMYVNSVNYPNDTPTMFGPFNFTESSQYQVTRIRNRQLQMQIGSSDVGSFWRIGKVRFRYAQDGRR